MRASSLASSTLGLLAALALACGDDGTGDAASDSITSASASASASATDTDASTTAASATDPTVSASATQTASATASASATDGSASATDATTTTASTSTAGTTGMTGMTGMTGETDPTSDSDASTTGVTITDSDSITDSDAGTDSDATTDTGCTPGTLGCPCDGGTCEGDLLCDADLCVAPGDPVCGNGIVEVGEACDDGNDNELDGCTSACEEGPVCPAGTEGCPCGGGESCNQGLQCQAGTCVVKPNAVCGNGVVEAGEACDDGNQQNFDACTTQCTKTNFAMDPCGFPEDGVWLNIDYKNAGSVYSPTWTYSNTPGYGETQWTANGKNWPEINLKGAVTLNQSDPIKPVADIGSGHWLRIMIGLGDLISYEYATVCITGRSISVGSSVTVDISNPAFGCYETTMLSNAWNLNPGGVNLGNDCLVAGNDFQAIQIQPNGGSSHLGLRSARITLHKPVF